MAAKVQRVSISDDVIREALIAKFVPRLEAVGNRIAENARKRAPVGRGEKTGRPESIVLSSGTKGLNARQLKARANIIGGEVREIEFGKFLATRARSQSESEATHEFAQLFRFAKGGGKPERVEVRKQLLRGFRRTKPHLRDTIRSEGVTVEGNRLHLTVAARSDHANLVEKGFHHKGGGQIAARPFLLPALMDEREGLANGRSLKG